MSERFPQLTADEVAWLDARRLQARLMRLVAINAYVAYHNTVVGNPAPAIEAQGKRSTHPRSGDVVLEISTVWRWAKDDEDTPLDQFPALGVLLRVAQESYPKVEGEDDPGDTEEVVYIRPLDGSVPEYRWTNASFIRVQTSLKRENQE